jgi:hypothetical protein
MLVFRLGLTAIDVIAILQHEWATGFDDVKDMAIASRQRVLDMVSADRDAVAAFICHFPPSASLARDHLQRLGNRLAEFAQARAAAAVACRGPRHDDTLARQVCGERGARVSCAETTPPWWSSRRPSRQMGLYEGEVPSSSRLRLGARANWNGNHWR